MSSTMRLGAMQPGARLIDYRIQDSAAVLDCVDDNLAALAQLVDRAGRDVDIGGCPPEDLGPQADRPPRVDEHPDALLPFELLPRRPDGLFRARGDEDRQLRLRTTAPGEKKEE